MFLIEMCITFEVIVKERIHQIKPQVGSGFPLYIGNSVPCHLIFHAFSMEPTGAYVESM